MVMTLDRFVKTDFGLFVGILLFAMGLISLMRGTTSTKRTATGTVLSLGMLVVGGYIIGKFLGYDI